jgi:hypothetical protein
VRGITRAEFALEAVQQHLENIKAKAKGNALAESLGSEELSKKYREANSKIAKSWWSKQSEKEKSERARRAVEARWGKKAE